MGDLLNLINKIREDDGESKNGYEEITIDAGIDETDDVKTFSSSFIDIQSDSTEVESDDTKNQENEQEKITLKVSIQKEIIKGEENKQKENEDKKPNKKDDNTDDVFDGLEMLFGDNF